MIRFPQARLAAALLAFLVVLGCSARPQNPEEEPHVEAAGLVLRAGGEVLVTVSGGAVAGEIVVLEDLATPTLSVFLLDADGNEFQSDPNKYYLDGAVAEGTLATYVSEVGWDFHVDGLSEGLTTLGLWITHKDHHDYDAPAIPLRVEGGAGHLDATGLVLRGGGEDLVTVNGSAVTGELFVLNGETSPLIEVFFLDSEGAEFQPGTEFDLQGDVGDTAVATFADAGPWAFRLGGVADGQTSLILSAHHVDHLDYSSPVIQVAVEEPVLSLAWTEPAPERNLVGLPFVLEVAATGTATASKVQFFADGLLLGEDATAPYTLDWDPDPALARGVRELTARALDAADAVLGIRVLEVLVGESAGFAAGRYGGAGEDRARACLALPGGGYALAGELTLPDGDVDAFLIRVDPTADLRVFTRYGGPGEQHARDLALTSDGGFALGGWTWVEAFAEPRFWLARTDADGVEQWSLTMDDAPEARYVHALKLTGDGGFLLAGEGGEEPGMCLVRASATGTAIWTSLVGDGLGGLAYDAVEDGAGYLGLGAKDGGDGFTRLWMVRVDGGGVLDWQVARAEGGDFSAGRAVVDDGNGFVMAGTTNNQLWLFKTDRTGTEFWSRQYGGAGLDQGFDLVKTADGGFAVAGASIPGGVERDLLLVKTDASGLAEWSATHGVTGLADEGLALAELAGGGYAVAGGADAAGLGDADIWLLRVDAAGNLTSD